MPDKWGPFWWLVEWKIVLTVVVHFYLHLHPDVSYLTVSDLSYADGHFIKTFSNLYTHLILKSLISSLSRRKKKVQQISLTSCAWQNVYLCKDVFMLLILLRHLGGRLPSEDCAEIWQGKEEWWVVCDFERSHSALYDVWLSPSIFTLTIITLNLSEHLPSQWFIHQLNLNM